jgi:hypothetical protein
MREDTARPHHGAGRDGAGRPTVEPAQIRLQVYNGGGTAGLGSRANADLAARGFATAGPAQNWSRTGVASTTIRFDTRYTESIKTVAAALPGARLVAVAGLGRTMQVVVGTSYDGARAVRLAAPRLPTPASAPRATTSAADRPSGVTVSRDCRMAARRASRCARRISASPTRRRSSAVSGSTGGTSRGRPSASTATNTR